MPRDPRLPHRAMLAWLRVSPCSMSRVRFVPAQSFVFEADSTRIVITSVSWYWLWRTDEA